MVAGQTPFSGEHPVAAAECKTCETDCSAIQPARNALSPGGTGSLLPIDNSRLRSKCRSSDQAASRASAKHSPPVHRRSDKIPQRNVLLLLPRPANSLPLLVLERVERQSQTCNKR